MSKRRRNKGMPPTPGGLSAQGRRAPVLHTSGRALSGKAADPSPPPAPAPAGEGPGWTTPFPCKGEGRGGGRSHAQPPEPTPVPVTRVPPSFDGKGRGGKTLCRPDAPDAALRPRFWETVPLDEMTATEWEALCDGCGKCCLLKLEDADTGRVHYTDVACRLYDCKTRSCGQYALRRMFVPGCVVLSPDTIDEAAAWMPATCAYRRLHEGRGLAGWHPLVSGDPASVERAGQALTWPTVPEYEVAEEDLEDHVLDRDLLEGSDG